MELVSRALPPDFLLEATLAASDLEFLWVKAVPFAARCEPSHSEGFVKIVAPSTGQLELRQGAHRAVLRPGTFCWMDPDAPFEVETRGSGHLQLRLPRALVDGRHPDIDRRTASVRGLSHPGERVVASFLRELSASGGSLSRVQAESAAATILEALGMLELRAPRDVTRERVARARADIDARLSEHALEPCDVARRQGVSRRYLDGLFRQHMGISLARYIREHRLERAAENLRCDPNALSADIANRWGFRDASHFTRIFRAHFGQTPIAYRRAILSARRSVPTQSSDQESS